MAAGYRVDLYCQAADLTALDAALDAVFGDGGTSSFPVTKTLVSLTFRYASLVINTPNLNGEGEPTTNDDTLSALLGALGGIGSVVYFVCTNDDYDTRTLITHNASGTIGAAWDFSDSDGAVYDATATLQANVYVSSTAVAGAGDGTENDPVTLLEALLEFPYKATSQVIFNDNTGYALTQNVTSYLAGVTFVHTGLQIDIGPYDLNFWGDDLIAKNVEYFTTNVPREYPDVQEEGALDRPGSVNFYGDNVNIDGSVGHDIALFGWWVQANGGSAQALVVYNNGGDDGTSLGNGPTVYTQNLSTSDPKYISGVFMPGYRYTAIQIWSTNNFVCNYIVDGMICVGGGPNAAQGNRFLLATNEEPMSGIAIDHLYTWDVNFYLGARTGADVLHEDVSIIHSVLVNTLGPVLLTNLVDDITFNTNTVVSAYTPRALDILAGLAPSLQDWDDNAYHLLGPIYEESSETEPGAGVLTFAQWQAATGFDANSTYAASLPTSNVVKVIDWQALNVQHLMAFYIANWELLDEVEVDLAAFGISLPEGEYVAVQAQDYLVDRRPISYNPAVSTILTFDMAPASVAVPANASVALRSTTFPQCGVFILMAAA